MKKFIIISYSLFLILFTLFSYLFVDTNLFYLQPVITGFFSNQRILTTTFYFSFLSIFFVFYMLFFILYKKQQFYWKDLKLLLTITILGLFFSYPAMLSFDIFNYMATAKVAFLYHENPYLIMPIEITKEPLLAFMHAPNKVALYGPLWILLTGIPYFLSLGKFLLFLFEMKALVVTFYIATIFLLQKISKNIFPVIFFALNPLVIIETLVNSHNDVVMVFFALLGLYFLLKNKRGAGIIFLVISILIKYATLFLIPVYWYGGRQKIVAFSALSMLVIFLLSPIREEMYPWYFIWVLVFVGLLGDLGQRPIVLWTKIIQILSVAFSFGLMLRYIPFMLLGTYFGPTPVLKIVLMILPILSTTIFFLVKHLFERST